MFGSSEKIGYDMTMKMKSSGNLAAIVHNRLGTFTIIKELLAPQALTGRATRCWQAQSPDGQTCVIKDSWPVKQREGNELRALECICNVEGAPRVISGSGPVLLEDGSLDTTIMAPCRPIDYFETRIHT